MRDVLAAADNEWYLPRRPRCYGDARMSGFLEVGTNGKGEVVINHPDLERNEYGIPHIVFSPAEAASLGVLLIRKADEAREELFGRATETPE